MASQLHLPSPLRSLSARLLVLTIAFVLLGEVLIYVPSIARFRIVYLDERIAAAHLATLSLQAAGEAGISSELENELLSHAGVLSVILREPAAELMLGKLPPVEKVIDLRTSNPMAMVGEAFETLRHGGQRTIRVIGWISMPGAVPEKASALATRMPNTASSAPASRSRKPPTRHWPSKPLSMT
jgi:hypothetical protein